ncbi:MAG: hypothetical protein ACI304_03885 [Lepagella sp.]
MKKILKIIGIFFLAFIVVGNVVRMIVKPVYENSIEVQIKRANQDCPIPVANGVGQLSSIKLEDNLLTYYIDYKPGYVNIEALKANPEATRDMFYLSLIILQAQGNYVNEMINELMKRNIGLRVIISDGANGKLSSILTPDYISNMNKRVAVNPSEALHQALKLQIQIEKNSFPVEVEEGLVMTGVSLEGNNLIAIVEMDENIYDLSLLEENLNNMGYLLLEEANNGDPELGALFDLCKISHSGLVYRFKGKQSKQQYDMGISSDEIRRLRKIPSQVNIH